MRNRKIFSFNEEKDAEEIINKGFPDGTVDYSKMYLVAKYFRKMFKYGEIRLEKELIKFCKSQDRNFNPVVESDSIKKWIKSAMNYELRKIDSITISQKEINCLKSIEPPAERRIIFVAFLLSKALKKRNTRANKRHYKASDNYYIHYNNFSDIIKLSKSKNMSEAKLAQVFNKHKQYFTFYNPEKELIRLDFVDPKPKRGISINLDRAVEHYDLLLGGSKPLGICIECGKEFSKNSNKQKRCKECSIKLRKEQKRLWIKNARML